MALRLPRLKCPYCFYEWHPKTKKPSVCPRCSTKLRLVIVLDEGSGEQAPEGG